MMNFNRRTGRCALLPLLFPFLLLSPAPAAALEDARVEIGADQVHDLLGVTGKGVTVAVLDRGINWRHPDFIRPDGKTRIRRMLDLSAQTLCNANDPAGTEYTEAQINQALANGASLGSRDHHGHGSATAGTAAGNGRALPDGRHAGIAPEADLIVAKMTSEAAPAHGDWPAADGFQGCIDEAIQWAADVMDELDQPGALIINSGVQWGPMDGTSAVSRKLAETFPPDRPGRIVVLPSGDEGGLPNHSRATFGAGQDTVIGLERASGQTTVLSAWYSGEVPAEVTIEFDDGTSVGPVPPGQILNQDGVYIIHYNPGGEFYPWLSSSGDRALWISIGGHATTGAFRIRAQSAADGQGTVDVYGDVSGPDLTPVTRTTTHLVNGRLMDYATTPGVIVVGNSVLRNTWTDLDGVARSKPDDGQPGALWPKSSSGPTRDGRLYGVDVVAPGQGLFAPVGLASYWSTLRGVLQEGSGGRYIRFGGASASAPLALGTVALMLQVNPTLNTEQARDILRATARQDGFTGALPNRQWGYGKLDALAAVRLAMARGFSGTWFNPQQSGHGWFVEMHDSGDSPSMTAYWYVFDDGAPAWLLATGPLVDGVATLDAYITANGEFPPDFTGADVDPWGTLELAFGADGSGTARWETDHPGFSSGSMPISQLSRISGRPEGCLSGSYYNTDQSGHGFVVEIIDSGEDLAALVAWYVYIEGEQLWLLGLAPFADGAAEIPLSSYAGADFPPDFVAADATPTSWGTLFLESTGPDSATVRWEADSPGFSDGALELSRLTRLGGQACAVD